MDKLSTFFIWLMILVALTAVSAFCLLVANSLLDTKICSYDIDLSASPAISMGGTYQEWGYLISSYGSPGVPFNATITSLDAKVPMAGKAHAEFYCRDFGLIAALYKEKADNIVRRY